MFNDWDWSIYGLLPSAKFNMHFWLIYQTVLNISLPSAGISIIFWTEPLPAINLFLIYAVQRFFSIKYSTKFLFMQTNYPAKTLLV